MASYQKLGIISESICIKRCKNWCNQKMLIAKIVILSWYSLIERNRKISMILDIISNFLSLFWKLHNRYCRTAQHQCNAFSFWVLNNVKRFKFRGCAIDSVIPFSDQNFSFKNSNKRKPILRLNRNFRFFDSTVRY